MRPRWELREPPSHPPQRSRPLDWLVGEVKVPLALVELGEVGRVPLKLFEVVTGVLGMSLSGDCVCDGCGDD